jgi:hypothetical protein
VARYPPSVKVFISWSGEPSRSIAQALDGWLERVVQHVDAWMSADEIGSGQRWNDAIAKSLSETDFGIVCLTRAKQHSPWLIFEAGALAKSLEVARVVPLCIDLVPAEVTGPLAAFQGRELKREDMRRLIQDISASSEKPMPPPRLDDVFDAMWPKLETAINAAVEGAPSAEEPQRSEADMLAEIVDIVRHLERTSQWMTVSALVADPTSPSRSSKHLIYPPELSGRAYIASYGPVEPAEESSEPEE